MMTERNVGSTVVGAETLFRPVNTGRISEEIVEQIKLAIRAGHVQLGDRLPSERDFAEQFGVSRVSVRDALRILETSGLIEIRVGARGGAYVTAPPSKLVGEGIANMLMLSVASPSDVTEARQVFETAIVPLVCERATDEDLEELGAICNEQKQALAGGDYSVELSARFHVALARATHNTAIEMLIESFRGPLLMSLERAKEVAPGMGRSGVREHLAMVEAIRDRDVDRAREIMSRHLRRTARNLAAQQNRRS
jgi:GntR family transcriptional repressor for pyruvate dehydrogenase complex